MEKKIISYEQLVVGGLLKFGIIDDKDIKIMMKDLNLCYLDKCKFSKMSDYIKVLEDNRIVFDEDKIKEMYEDTSEFYECAQLAQGIQINEYLSSLNVSEFVLEKIKLLGGLRVEDIDRHLSDLQKNAIDKLVKKDYAFYYWPDVDVMIIINQ